MFTVYTFLMAASPKRMKITIAISLSLLMLMIVIAPGLQSSSTNSVSNADRPGSSFEMSPPSLQNLGPNVMVPYAQNSVSPNGSVPYTGTMNVMVTFSLSNQSKLNSLLSNLSNPLSKQYHRYLTRSEFSSAFSPSETYYNSAVSYINRFAGVKVTTYQDRLSIVVSAPSSVIDHIFNTNIEKSSSSSQFYFASSGPELPAQVAAHVTQVTGLANQKVTLNNGAAKRILPLDTGKVATIQTGYPAPVESSGVQYIYGSDLQVAYDEQSLLNVTYPTNEVIATILWAGSNSTGAPVGPFYPSDIYAYYNATLPAYEPHSKVYGVPLNGAVKPGVSASYDVTGANDENTLDLEMVGSTAPGANIYNVYGPNGTSESLDDALAFILNPNSTYSALNNVSVISNSWGGQEYNNTAWYEYLQEAQVRGISVLASSGDSGDNNASSKYTGTQLEFPAAMAYNTFGVTAVGGTTLTLTQNLHILNQTAWYISSSDSADGGPAGSVGGVSTVFKEPDFQLNTEANNVLHGAGRGVPDISAVANNTIVYITVNGTNYYGNPAFYPFWGTSIASPAEAGIVAEVDAILHHYNESNLGYLNPLIYGLANKQVSTPSTTETTGYIPTGNYNSSLPALPFYNVVAGRNHVYNATFGYNLVTGWGSIDAYNMTMYLLNINRSTSANGLKGVFNSLSLTDLNVTSYLYNSTSSTYYVNTFYNASIQQNLFLANQFGAPLYWIQNVVYINGSQSVGWTVNYTGWVIYPFYGQYPYETVYEYNFPMGKVISMPHVFNVKTWISNLSIPMQQTINFQLNSQIISLPVPGAAYIIDSQISSQNYSYTWQGNTYYNGPYPDNPYPGGLNPQFGLVGGPSGGLGLFANPTSGAISAYVEPMDFNSYVPAVSKVLNLSVDETAEKAESLNFVQVNASTWTLSVNQNSASQGIVDYAPVQYSQTFVEQGLPSGTDWSINLNGTEYSTTSSNLSVSLVNGSYTAQVSSPTGYFPTPSEWLFTVQGQPSTFTVAFASSRNQTYIKPAETLYPLTNQTFVGSVFNNSYSPNALSYGMAFDSSLRLLFIPEFSSFLGQGSIYVYNTTTGQFIKTISGFGSYDALYNPNTGMVYSMSFSGNLTEINPSTMSVVKNLTLTNSIDNITFLQQQGTNIYALSSNGNISIINASTLSLTRTIYVGQQNYISPLFTIYGQNAFFANATGNDIVIVNLTTSSVKQVYLPQDYAPVSVLNYYGSTLLIGGENYTDQIYNATSGSMSAIQRIPQTAYSATYDGYSNMVYIASGPYNGSGFGNMTVINPASGTILATIPSVGILLGMFFNPVNQQIYVTDIPLGIVSVYSAQHYYKATFTESGLPAGTTWYVNGTSMNSGPITGSTYSVNLPNGTYTFTIATSDKEYLPSPSSGSFKVNGASAPQSVIFSKVTYTVTFTESGLPSGSTWYVNITGQPSSGPITGSSYSFHLINGTYPYTIQTANKVYEPSLYSGSFTVNGAPVPETVTFSKVTYTVTFTESGLPSGTTWYVNGTGVSGHDSSPTNITFTLTNGTYTFTITNLSGYYTTTSQFSVHVNGNNVTETVQYYHWAYIAGSISPGNAALTVNGNPVSVSSSGNFNVSVANGTYHVVASENGYSTYYNNFTLNNGGFKNLTIDLKSVPKPSTISSTEIYAIIGVVAAIAVIAGIVLAMRRR